MHRLKLFVTGCLLSIISSAVFSADLYYGFRFGFSRFDTGISNTTGTARLEENDFGFKLLTGIPLSHNTAIEAFYTDYGEATLGGHAGDTFTLNDSTFNFIDNDSELSSGLTAFGLNAVYNYSFSQSQALLVKLGIMRWENNFKIQSPFNTLGSTENDLDLYWSLGLEQKLGKSLALIFEYETVETEDIDLTSVAVTFAVKF